MNPKLTYFVRGFLYFLAAFLGTLYTSAMAGAPLRLACVAGAGAGAAAVAGFLDPAAGIRVANKLVKGIADALEPCDESGSTVKDK